MTCPCQVDLHTRRGSRRPALAASGITREPIAKAVTAWYFSAGSSARVPIRIVETPATLCVDEYAQTKEVVMSLIATARSIPGTLRQDVLIDGRHRLTTDEPEHLGGEGMGPAPHELFPAALAACVSTTLVMYARMKEWDLGEVTVHVDYDHHATPRRMEIDVGTTGGDLDPEQLARLEKVAAACPLRKALDTGIEFEERFSWQTPTHAVAEPRV